MLFNDFSFFFSLDNGLYSKNFHEFSCNFFATELNEKFILIGHCPKECDKRNIEDLKKEILNENDFWNKNELEELKLLFEKNKSHRLFDWFLERVLLKLGIVLYWKKKNIDFIAPFKSITLLNCQRNKPLIKVFSENQTQICNVIPFISFSHTKRDIYIALSSNPIGLDTELITKHSEVWEKKIFSPQETEKIFKFLKRWSLLPRETIYTIMWSIKEATLKIDNELSLGNLPEIIIEIKKKDIITKIPLKKKSYMNYISIDESSVLVLTI